MDKIKYWWEFLSVKAKRGIMLGVFALVALIAIIIIVVVSGTGGSGPVEPSNTDTDMTYTPEPGVDLDALNPTSEPVFIVDEEKVEPKTRYVGVVKGVVENSNNIVLQVQIDGTDEEDGLVTMQIVGSTICYDTVGEQVVQPSFVTKESPVTVVAIGNIVQNNITALTVLIGEDDEIRYGRVSSLNVVTNEDGSKSYNVGIENDTEKLIVTNDTVVADGVAGIRSYDLSVLKEGAHLFYHVVPNSESHSLDCLTYTAESIRYYNVVDIKADLPEATPPANMGVDDIIDYAHAGNVNDTEDTGE